eukprot:TRINITY_DN5004_c0_g1_i1.p1 TRINITY_DN5004_c0_g1~~TRINITY_DN5004_c0_g1_i1.p1  ORF type:complete len:552 (-),score=122.76 TRINITY_DN5004_c0_g1_i1:60-1715(-)
MAQPRSFSDFAITKENEPVPKRGTAPRSDGDGDKFRDGRTENPRNNKPDQESIRHEEDTHKTNSVSSYRDETASTSTASTTTSTKKIREEFEKKRRTEEIPTRKYTGFKRSRDDDNEGRVDSNNKRRKIMIYSKSELDMRTSKLGSELTLLDRRKFLELFRPGSTQYRSMNLSKEEEQVYTHNHHIRQVFANNKQFIRPRKSIVESDRYINECSGLTPYGRRQGDAKTVEHWGQRKLLLSEIEFLTNWGMDREVVVIYAGAAPGAHTNYLSELFPKAHFHLVDPADFRVTTTKMITVVQDYFTDKMAHQLKKKYKDQEILFISDVRSIDHNMSDKMKEERVMVDMNMQMEWHKILKPTSSMLKFRLPYPIQYNKEKRRLLPESNTAYLKGKLYFQIWAGRTSSETRLVVTGDETTSYNHYDYEDMLYHFNTVTRTTYWEHNVISEGLDHCYDCSSEVYVLSNYLRKLSSSTSTTSTTSTTSLTKTSTTTTTTTDSNIKEEEEEDILRHEREESDTTERRRRTRLNIQISNMVREISRRISPSRSLNTGWVH